MTRVQVQNGGGLTRHGVAIEVVSDGLLQLVVSRGFLEALAQVVLQVLVQLTSCHCGHKTGKHVVTASQQQQK